MTFDTIFESRFFNRQKLRIAEQYLSEFEKLASINNTMIILSDFSDIAVTITSAASEMKKTAKENR